jgi:hypothetical protein
MRPVTRVGVLLGLPIATVLATNDLHTFTQEPRVADVGLLTTLACR